MAGVRFYHPLALILLLWTGAARAQAPQNPAQLYDRPVLAVDPGTHTAAIKSASADRDGRWAITGSETRRSEYCRSPTASLNARSACRQDRTMSARFTPSR